MDAHYMLETKTSTQGSGIQDYAIHYIMYVRLEAPNSVALYNSYVGFCGYCRYVPRSWVLLF